MARTEGACPVRVFVLSWILLAFVTPAQGAYSLEKLDRLWFPGVIDEGDTLGGSDVWGYIGPDSTDYAIMGIRDGIVVCEVVEDGDSAYLREVQQVAGPTEDDYYYHRDIKTFGNYAYVVAEMSSPGGGIQVIDLSGLPASVELVNTITAPGQIRSHNLSIDVNRGYMYVLRETYDGFRVFDLGADPVHPPELDFVPTAGIHDVYARNDTVWVAEGWEEAWSIYDLTDKDNPQMIARKVVPTGGYLHNIWPSDDGNIVITTEETRNNTVKVWDTSDLANIEMVGEFLGSSDLAHNAHVMGGLVITSHYESGVTVVDISDPTDPTEVAVFDTFPRGDRGRFRGCWGAFPYTAGGYVYSSDLESYLTLMKLETDPTDIGGDIPVVPGVTFAALMPNRPNPFNPWTTIPFRLERAGTVRLAVHDAAGRKIRSLSDGILPVGQHVRTWDGRDDHGKAVPSGVYLCVLETNEGRETRRMLLVR